MKTGIKKIFENASALMIATGLQPVFNFALVLFISRLFSAQGLGAYTTAFALCNVFQLFCAFGMKMYLAREVAKYPDSVGDYLANGLVIVFGFSIISVAGMLLSVFILGYSPEVARLANLLAISLVATALIECFLGVLTGFERLKFIALITILEEFFKVIVSVILLHKGYGIVGVVISYIVFRFASAIVILIYLYRSLEIRTFHFNLPGCIDTIKKTAFFAFSIIFMAIYWQADVIILSKIGTIEDVGIYGAAFRLFRIIFVLMQSILMAMYPVLSKSHHENVNQFVELYKRTAKYLIILTIPFSVAMIVFADRIILLVFDSDFIPSFGVLKILIAGLTPFIVSNLLAFVLLASDNHRLDFLSNIMGVIVKIIFVYYLTQKTGFIGTAIGAFIAFWGRMIVQTLFLWRKRLTTMHIIPWLHSAVKYILILVVFVGTILLVKNVNLYLAFVTGMVVYVITVLKLMFSTDEKSQVRRMIGSKWLALKRN